MKKYLCVIELKQQFEKQYIDIHKNAWREMLVAIRESGFTNEVLFIYKQLSIVYLECSDDTTLQECDERLRKTEVCKNWDITVCPWFLAEPVICEKIFDLNQQLEGKLLPD